MSLDINTFDSEYYFERYPDLQQVAFRMRPPERHAFLFRHFVQHGLREKRSYRLKSDSNSKSDSKSDSNSKLNSLENHQKVEKRYRIMYPHSPNHGDRVIDFDCNDMSKSRESDSEDQDTPDSHEDTEESKKHKHRKHKDKENKKSMGQTVDAGVIEWR